MQPFNLPHVARYCRLHGGFAPRRRCARRQSIRSDATTVNTQPPIEPMPGDATEPSPAAAPADTPQTARQTDDGAPVLFQALLHPHRSLSPRGFYVLMGMVAAVSVSVGGAFFAIGAWPILGFYGLDVLVIYLFMRANYRSALVYERIKLTEDQLTIERGDHRGLRATYRFQPYWLRVSMDDPPQHHSQLVLTSHGRSVVLGAFLAPEERADFARALTRALRGVRPDPTLQALPA